MGLEQTSSKTVACEPFTLTCNEGENIFLQRGIFKFLYKTFITLHHYIYNQCYKNNFSKIIKCIAVLCLTRDR